MKVKIIVSFMIFFVLFSLAWLWDKDHVREFYDPSLTSSDEEIVEIIPITHELVPPPKRYEVFKSREYVRIEEL